MTVNARTTCSLPGGPLHYFSRGFNLRSAIERSDDGMRGPCKFTEADLRHAIGAHTQANDNWPPVLTRCEAAKMCTISVQTFDSWVRKGVLPGPIPGTRRWSRYAIERCLAGDAPSANDQPSPFEQWKHGHAH